MKTIILLFTLFPTYCFSQIADEIYNKLFLRPFEIVSFSEIKKFKIKRIKYTVNRIQPQIDSSKTLKYTTEYQYENFDTHGMINGYDKTTFSDKKYYASQSLFLLKNIKKNLTQKSDFAFHDSIAQYVIIFDKSAKLIKVKNYSNFNVTNGSYRDFLNENLEFKYPIFDVEPWFFFLDEKFELTKDSSYYKGILGCEDLKLGSFYQYNSKGQIVEKTSLHSQSKKSIKYDYEGNIHSILVNNKLYATYYYKKKRLSKIIFETDYGLKLIEIE